MCTWEAHDVLYVVGSSCLNSRVFYVRLQTLYIKFGTLKKNKLVSICMFAKYCKHLFQSSMHAIHKFLDHSVQKAHTYVIIQNSEIRLTSILLIFIYIEFLNCWFSEFADQDSSPARAGVQNASHGFGHSSSRALPFLVPGDVPGQCFFSSLDASLAYFVCVRACVSHTVYYCLLTNMIYNMFEEFHTKQLQNEVCVVDFICIFKKV